MSEQVVGKRITCQKCGTQVVVMKRSQTEFACCGRTMAPVAPAEAAAS